MDLYTGQAVALFEAISDQLEELTELMVLHETDRSRVEAVKGSRRLLDQAFQLKEVTDEGTAPDARYRIRSGG